MITVEQINLWLNVPSETQNLEFKEAKQAYDFAELCKYCVAIANEGGGHLLLGVSDKNPRTVVGTAAFPSDIKVTEQLFNKLGFRVDVEDINHPLGRVLVFIIPSRPKGATYDYEGARYMRSGSQLVAMTDDQMRRIYSEGAPDWLEGASLSGLDSQQVVELLDTQSYFELLKQPYPVTKDAVIDKLRQERLIDAVDGTFAIRRLGALLLAKNLKEFPDISRKAPRVVVYNGTNKLDTKLDQTGTLGYAVGFQRLVKFIMSQLPQNEVIEDALRKEVKLVPEDVIRELVANALIHQDIGMSGVSVMVEIYSDRVEITNPGLPIIRTERFIDGYQSRNERLADVMRRMYICEEKGSGIDRVVRTIEAYQLPAPDFREGNHKTSVIIFGHIPFEDMNRDERVRACYQHAALKWVMNGKMTNESLRERFRLPDSKSQTASQVIGQAMDAGLILLDESVGKSRKHAKYIPFWAGSSYLRVSPEKTLNKD